jgi:CPA2 family monovalent cation:H+ antiporter-2
MTPEDTGPELPGRTEPEPGATAADGFEDHVIVAGYGQWARGVTRVLQENAVPVVVTTLSPEGATDAYDQGLPVLLGDPARTRTLAEAGMARAKAVVVPDDGAERAGQIVRVVKSMRDDVVVIVRVRYADDAAQLTADGADFVVTEELEASAGLAAKVLKQYGHDVADAVIRAHDVRRFYADAGPPLAARPPQHAVVDTQARIDVALDPGACPHVAETRPVLPRSAGCEECLRTGDSWVHLRVCLTCGHVGCCDSSPNRHARRHHDDEGHHVVRSGEPGESWVFCFADDRILAEETDPPVREAAPA